jgi:mono/diheme cytochrome c family protein
MKGLNHMWKHALIGALMLPGALPAQELSDAAKITFFGKQVFPILKESCFKCHGAKAKLKGKFRVTSRRGLLKGGEEGPALNLKEPDKSSMLTMLSYKDEDHEMPPDDSKLPQAQIDILTKWVRMGAPFDPKLEIVGKPGEDEFPTNEINERTRKYWAYQPIANPPVPKVADPAWAGNPIDAFIYARLATKGMKPNGPATRQQLIRRAYYDLIGLPPPLKVVKTFETDKSPDAFEKVIDDLLTRSQYGEKWGRHWLDLVRYAETNGYERDSRKDLMWKYRDYVINSFNEDKSYDRFLMEQLAGDELPDRDAASITATGYYRLGIWDDEPADRPLARYDYLDDILRTTGETFLGMTVGCARCHEHKIDPFPQEDYYSMLSFFVDISPHGKGKTNHVPLTTPREKENAQKQKAERQKRIQVIQAKLNPIEEKLLDELAKKNPALRDKAPKGTKKLNNPYALPDASRGKGQTWEYTTTKPGDNWFEIAFDDKAWKKGPAGFGKRGTPGSHVRTEWKTSDIWLRKDFRLVEIPGKLVLRINHDEDAEVYLNGKLVKSLKGHIGRYIDLDITEASLDVMQTGRNTIAMHCHQTSGGQYIDAGLLVDYNITPVPLLARLHGKAILGEASLAEYNKLHQQLTTLEQQKLEVQEEFAMAVAERGRAKTWVLKRGSPANPGAEMSPAFPVILGATVAKIPKAYDRGTTSGKRRYFADWLLGKDHPLTSRVLANRLWQHHFGRGIVRTTNNFGYSGAIPTHPVLLDWLAREIMRGGWKLKRVHKLIMMSRAYQMSSTGNQKNLATDPNNDLLWRFDMRRLTAEEIRDSILSLTGQLNLKMGGPSIYSEIPPDVLKTASRPGGAWGRSSKEDAARRSVYIYVKRSLHEPFLSSFDWADTDNTCDVRFVTTVPTQTLTMMNSKFLNDSAEVLSKRLQEELKTVPEQISRAIELATSRTASKVDIADGVKLIETLTEAGVDKNQALQRFCLLALNLNEFLYLD